MIIVSGFLLVDPAVRDAYVEGCKPVVQAARAAAGCLDFHISGDPIEADRVNVYERWDSTSSVEAFRANGPTDEQVAEIIRADVREYGIASSTRL